MEKPKSLTNITTILLLAFGLLALSTSFAVSLFTSAAEAKPATVRLQEGLYAEEIDGDLDAAMKIYEQIISDKSAQNSCVAKAMYRLGMCYIKKQNELQAKAVFEKLVVQFPEQTSIVEKVQPLLDKMSNPDPAALMPPDTKIYLEFGSPGRQIEKILNMLKGTPFENPLAALGGGKPGEKSPGDVMAALLNPSMIQEFKKIRGMAIGFTGIRGNNPPVIVVLYPGKSDALRGILLAGLGMVGTPGDPIEGMQTLIIQNTAGAAYDDEVIIMGQPLDQLTWSAKQYKGVTAEASLASENKLFSKLSRKSREENAVTIWLDGAATFAAISEQMARSGQSAQLRLVDGVADFGSVEEAIAHLRVEERGFATELSVGFKDGHRCLAYDLIRTPNLSTAGFEAVPVEAVGLVSFALGEAESGRMERMERTVKELTGLDIGRELFMNVEQVTLFALPPSPAFQENVLAQRFSPVLDRLGLVVTSKNPEQTRQLLSRFLTVAGLVGEASANAEVGREEGTVAGKYKIGVFDNQPAYCYMEQAGKATILALSPEVSRACVSAARKRESALTDGPLHKILSQLSPDTSKLAAVNVGGAILLVDSFIKWKFDNPKNPGHQLLGQLAQACDKTSVRLRTRERRNHFNLYYSVEELPPLGAVFPTLMALSQTNLQAKSRATEARPSEGAVVGVGTKVELKWSSGVNAKAHKVYFGTQEEELSLLDEVKEPSYTELPPAEKDKTYYWRIDEVQPDGSAIEGDVWSYSTGKLAAWWKFDETSGTRVADSSGNGYHGTVIEGKPIWDPDGKHGGCLNFDETYGITIPKEVFGGIDRAITISVWVNGNENQPDHGNVILKAGAGSRGLPYIITVHTKWKDNGEVLFKTGRREIDRVTYNAALDEWAGRWNHYAFVKDADKGFQRIYLNGTLVAEEKGTKAPMSGVDAARIGIAPDRFGDQYIGKLDDLHIYNYSLTEQEIGALCPMPKASAPKPRNKAVIGPTKQLELSWKPGTNATRHEVYMGSRPDKMSLLAEAADPSYETLTDIEPGATYYWRIDEVQDDGPVVTGDVWSFSTGGLIGWWKFDEGSGLQAMDSSGMNHHGVLKNMAEDNWVEGMIGTALDFDGTDDYVATTLDIDQGGSTAFTMAAWVYPTSTSEGRHQVISSDDVYWDWSLLREGKRWYAFTGDESWDSGLSVDINKWQHVAVVFKPNEDVVFYKNRQSRSKGAAPVPDRSDNNITIGDNPGPWDEYFAGRIDDVRVYNYALSDGEIGDICQGGRPGSKGD